MKVSKAWATYLPAGTKQVIAKLQTNSLSSSGILSWDSFMLQRQNNGSDWDRCAAGTADLRKAAAEKELTEGYLRCSWAISWG